jgi:MFS family permease
VTLAVACLAGFALAWAAGANPRLLAEVRLRWTGFVLAALALQLATFAVHVPLPWNISTTEVHVASYLLLLAFAARNGRVPGFALAGLGFASNAIAIFLNGGRMPVSAEAWADSTGMGTAAYADHVYNNVATANAGSHLAFLGDVFALPHALPFANTFSIGDVLLVAGATLFVYRNGRRNEDRSSSGAFEPLEVPEFRALLAARTISKLGDWISIAALVTWIYAHSHSTLGVSAILAARLTASIAGSVVSSIVLDRFGRFAILARVEAGRALITIAAVALVASDHSFAVVACVFASSFLAAATDPTASSLVAEILPPGTLHAGNALHAVSRAAVMAVGAIAGGLVAASIGAVPALAADCGTFLAAVALYSVFARRMPRSQPNHVAAKPADGGPEGSHLEGLRCICNSRRLAALVGSFAVATFAMGLLNASLPAFLSVHAPHAGGYGVAIGVIAAGLMCGEFLSGRAPGRVVERIPALGFAAAAVMVSVAAASDLPATILLLLFVLGVSDGTTETAYDTVVQAEAPRALSGRVFALAGAVQQTAMVAGFVTAPILQRTLADTALSTSGLALGASALIAMLVIAPRRQQADPAGGATPLPRAAETT